MIVQLMTREDIFDGRRPVRTALPCGQLRWDILSPDAGVISLVQIKPFRGAVDFVVNVLQKSRATPAASSAAFFEAEG